MHYDFTAEDTAEHLRGLQDSADLIDRLIADGERSDETLGTMGSNVDHIRIMCAMPHLASSDLAPFLAAERRGRSWMLSPDV